jgi:hypothetical protein
MGWSLRGRAIGKGQNNSVYYISEHGATGDLGDAVARPAERFAQLAPRHPAVDLAAKFT